MRCLEKIPNGKLVAVDVIVSAGKVVSMKITGDFFLYPEEQITALEAAFVGVSPSLSDSELSDRIKQAIKNAELIGVSVDDLIRIFRKATL
ncbi:Uncharacterised protein [Candidatus Bilamarchaeum dharawalense]|uniref:lipoate--protein ligase n=1 Tax=Candidatus Bilamarchaeum dharawalense TaxID=2885759 RepID=A0A5E4LRW7_9ARCH|nr:Uncharacterised protein [Candidatus Bilamarchaeum dharawalense]